MIFYDILIFFAVKMIGQLSSLQHNVSGVLHATDGKNLRLTQFNYDGAAAGGYRPTNKLLHIIAIININE